jgi:hypothetical protein
MISGEDSGADETADSSFTSGVAASVRQLFRADRDRLESSDRVKMLFKSNS